MKYKKSLAKLAGRKSAFERSDDSTKKACKAPGSQNRHKN